MKKVMLLSPDFGFGGAERSIAKLSILLSAHYEIHFVVFNDHINQVYPVNGRIHTLKVMGSKTLMGKLIGFIQRAMRLRKLKRNLIPHACISFLEGSDYLNVITKYTDSVIVSLRGSKAHDQNIKGLMGFIRHKILIPWAYKRADRIVAVDSGLLMELWEKYDVPKKIRNFVIPNFYDKNEIQSIGNQPLPSNWKLFFNKHKVIVASGRIAPEKGFDFLIKVFASLFHDDNSCRLVIIGSGPDEGKLRMLCDKLQLPTATGEPDTSGGNHAVIFAGYVKQPFTLMESAKLFVLSSLTEGFPNALVEAMCLGLPVVAANCPHGPANILGDVVEKPFLHEYGILLPILSDDPSVLNIWRKELRGVLNDEQKRMRLKEKSFIRSEKYDAHNALKMWREVIET